jgi:hypothetical protein
MVRSWTTFISRKSQDDDQGPGSSTEVEERRMIAVNFAKLPELVPK